jgi:outer membrane murein-binding lipoprotein Lpp
MQAEDAHIRQVETKTDEYRPDAAGAQERAERARASSRLFGWRRSEGLCGQPADH